MGINRRGFFKLLGVAGATLAIGNEATAAQNQSCDRNQFRNQFGFVSGC